jgi:uncharacterized protein YjiS (DUF1127 family)
MITLFASHASREAASAFRRALSWPSRVGAARSAPEPAVRAKSRSRIMMTFFANLASRALGWPARVGAARRTMSQLARMSDYELRDIGLTRQDVADANALPLDADPSSLLVRRRAARATEPGRAA